MPRFSAETVADKQIRNLGNSLQDIQKGVEAVTASPMAKAAARADKWAMNVANSKERYKAGLLAVSLEDWKKAFIEKGIARIGPGIQAARPKLIKFYNDFLPFLDTVKAKVDSMPSMTLQDSLNRMTTAVTMISQYKRK